MTADPLELTPKETISTLKESGGFVVARYTNNERQSDIRYNPITKQFEQIVVIKTVDETEVCAYEQLPESIALSLFHSANDSKRTVTSIVEYTESNFSLATTLPDSV